MMVTKDKRMASHPSFSRRDVRMVSWYHMLNVTMFQHKNMKPSLPSLPWTQTHSRSRKEETESSTRSEWRTNFTSALCRMNSLTYSLSCYPKPSRSPSPPALFRWLMHTLCLWYTLERQKLCVTPAGASRGAESQDWYRDSSSYCIFTTTRRPSLDSDMFKGELRAPGGTITKGGVGGGVTWWGFGKVLRFSLKQLGGGGGGWGGLGGLENGFSCAHVRSPQCILKACLLLHHHHQLVIPHHHSAPQWRVKGSQSHPKKH